MTRNKNLLTGTAAAVGMLMFILDARTVISGAKAGIELCISTVIPSLFPFFILSMLLTSSLMGRRSPLLRPFGVLCGMPSGSESLLVVGYLAGYPVGAQNVNQARLSGQLDPSDAERLLAFCNNAGPAFIFGLVSGKFQQTWIPWFLWFIHVLSSLLSGFQLKRKNISNVILSSGSPLSLAQAMERSIHVMAGICGWVMIFRVILSFLGKWFLHTLPKTIHIIVSGILELSNGCCELHRIPNTGLRMIICSAFLAFGGLCVTMQTVSVTTGMKLNHYFSGKSLQTLISLLLSYYGQLVFLPTNERICFHPVIPILLITGILFIKLTVDFQESMLYNWFMRKKKRCQPCCSEKISPVPVNIAPEVPNTTRSISSARKRAW